MPEKISVALGRVGTAIKEFTIAQRTLALIGVAAVAVLAIGLVAWTSRPTMTPLYTGLAAADASAVVDSLEAEGVKYELADGGSTVMVPKESVYKMRLATAAAGLPAATDGGYSLLDDMGMSSSQFQQTTTYKRAMEGELARTIGALQGVKTASVQLALPEKTVFVSEKADPTASVFVELDRGANLSDDQVQAVVHLVSAAIEGMKPTDVAVIDAAGNVLSAVGTGAAGTSGNKQTREYEQRVASSVQGMLDRIVGSGHAVVSVTADLDFDQTTKTSESFKDSKAKPLSETNSKEEYTGTGSNSTGVLGPDNIAVPNGNDKGNGNYKNESSTKNNAVDKVTEVTAKAPGTVRRQTISVAVDQKAAAALDMTELTGLVSTAAGIDTDRGDVVTVSRLAFDESRATAAQEALAAEKALAAAAEKSQLIRSGAIAGAILLAVIVLALSIRKSRRKSNDDRVAVDLGDLAAVPVLDATTRALDVVAESEVALALTAPVDQTQLEAEAKRNELAAAADDNPVEVAERLRALLDAGAR